MTSNKIYVSAQTQWWTEQSVWDQTTALLKKKEALCFLGCRLDQRYKTLTYR